MNSFALIHSPLTGPDVWWPVAECLRSAGHEVIVPDLQETAAIQVPYWRQDVDSAVAGILGQLDEGSSQPLVLAGHSGAGQLLAAIGEALPVSPAAYLFVDAGLPPLESASRLDQMASEDAVWAAQFAQSLGDGETFPIWTSDDLANEVPDTKLRETLVANLRPHPLAYFTESLWPCPNLPTLPGAVLRFSPAYETYAATAALWVWPVATISAGHFHMLVDPTAVADAMIELV